MFDYKEFVGKELSMSFIKDNVNNITLRILLNSGNYFFNKEKYIEAYNSIDKTIGKNSDPCDVFYFNYHFLINNKKGNITVVDGLKYYHRVHEGSFYVNNAKKNEQINNDLINRINEYQ